MITSCPRHNWTPLWKNLHSHSTEKHILTMWIQKYLPYCCLQEGGFVPPPPQSTSAASYCDAQVQAITGTGMQMGLSSGLIHPLLLGVQGQRPTLSQKHQGGWTTFKKKWEQHMQMVMACNKGNPIPDMLLLQYFSQTLDSTDQLLLENMSEKNPNITFGEVWDYLSSLYDRDTQAQLRMAWENVRLQEGALTLEKWLNFQREFQLKRDRVEERTPQEEYKLLMRSLPKEWQKKVLEEEAKRGKHQWLVRMTNIPNKPPRLLKHLIESALNLDLQHVISIPQGALIHCPDANSQTKVLRLAGHSLDGHLVKCSRVDPTLDGDQLAEFILQKLLTEQKLHTMRQTWAEQPKSSNIQMIDSKTSADKGKGKSQHPNSINRYPSPNNNQHSRSSKGRDHSPRDNNHQRYTRGTPTTEREHCGFCDSEGRNSKHLPSTCTQWKTFQNKQSKTCFVCLKAGKPSNHFFKECTLFKEQQAAKKRPYNGRPQPGAQQPPFSRPLSPKRPEGASAPPSGNSPTQPNKGSPRR